MTKEQLFDLFQQVLNIKKFEHQLLYNAMQVRKTFSFKHINKDFTISLKSIHFIMIGWDPWIKKKKKFE